MISQTSTLPSRPAMSPLDADLAKRVGLALVAKWMELRNVDVWADRGSVRLAGTVKSFYVRQLAVSLARHVAGVVEIIDELEVESEQPASRCDVPPPKSASLYPSSQSREFVAK